MMAKTDRNNDKSYVHASVIMENITFINNV